MNECGYMTYSILDKNGDPLSEDLYTISNKDKIVYTMNYI
jgi:hypothetical protein